MLKYHQKQAKCCRGLLDRLYSNMDMFSQQPAFLILKKRSFTSTIGLIFTLATFFICFVQFYLQLESLFYQRDPKVIISESQISDSNPYPLRMDNFTLAITMTTSNIVSLTTLGSHFQFDVSNCRRARIVDPATNKTTIQSNCTKYPTEACSERHFASEVQREYFSKVRLGAVQCLNAEQWLSNPPILQGTVQGMVFQYITITVSECKNSTTYNKCASKEEIKKGLSSGNYAVHLYDNLVLTGKSGSPFQEIVQLFYTTFAIASSKTVYSTFKIIDSETDDGLVTTDPWAESKLIQGQGRESQDLYNGEFIISHQITLDGRSVKYERSYVKFQEILGNVGGLWSVLYLICAALLNPITSVLMNLQMANKLFLFQSALEEQEQGQEDRILFERSPGFSLSPKGDVLSSQSGNEALGQPAYMSQSRRTKSLNQLNSEAKIHNFLKEKKKSLNLGVKDVLMMICGCRQKIKTQIDYATDKFMQKLDVAFMIQKFYEIEKLKHILLTEQQQSLFHYIPKPVIPKMLFSKDSKKQVLSIEQDKAYKFILQEEQPDLKKLQNAYLAYVQIMQSEEKSSIDSLILETLDKDILALFEDFRMNSYKVNNIFKNSPGIQPLSADSPSRFEDEEFSENIKVGVSNLNVTSQQRNALNSY